MDTQIPTNNPIVLVIIDGWGIAPEGDSNPLSKISHPYYDQLRKESKATRLWAHGEYVGLLRDQDGNSEAGHLNLGAGRIVKQDQVIISEAIEDGTFFKNPAFLEAIQHVKRNKSSMHLVGMLSDGQSAHATPEHLYALLELLEKEKVERVFLHLFSDGRDSSPKGGKNQLKQVIEHLKPNQLVATVMGRFFAMDRRKEWSRTQQAYNSLVLGEGKAVENPLEVFDQFYSEGISDEFIPPHVVVDQGKPVGMIQDNDSIIFFNHRSDRARQITKVFVQEDFTEKNPGSFTPKKKIQNLRFVAMTDFGPDLGNMLTAYPSIDVDDTLPMVLKNKRQLYMAESEKYAHITYFFNGGYAEPVNHEDRLVITSPDVDSYDKAPAMATKEIANTVARALNEKKYDFIAVNIAAPDMVAHSGNFEAAKEAIKATDSGLGIIMSAVKQSGAILIVTADHGNIEEMKDMSLKEKDTEHSKNQVPFLIWAPNQQIPNLREEGVLGDVAPTIIQLFRLQKPQAMTGKSLIIP